MDTIKEGNDVGRKKSNSKEIVPVHNSNSSLKRTVMQRDLSQKTANMVVNEEMDQNGGNKDDGLSPWVWGGPLGGKGTVLVFRSCVLAPKDKPLQQIGTGLANSTSHSSTLSSQVHQNSKEADGKSKPDDSKNCQWEPESCSDFKSNGAQTSTESIPCDIKRKRDIQDFLSDINKITLKKKLNINNSTAKISKSVESQYSDVILKSDGTSKPNKKESNGFFTMPSIHKDKKKVSVESSSLLSSLAPKSVTMPPVTKPIAYSEKFFSLDSLNGDIISVDIKNLKIPDRSEMPAAILHITYKTAMTETKLLNRMLQAHGFTDVDLHCKDFNLFWSGLHAKPDVLKSLASHQRVNHFPRSYELTRKDKLFKNIEKMQYFRGLKNFDFIPMTFIMPVEYKELCTTHYRIRGPWIVKPAASSRGRGIYIVKSPDQIPTGESVVVAKYIDKPLLVDGHKCDLRLYVCVTSFDPLLIYMYEEGMVRFATVKYDKSNKNLWNPCMHLCNYSINKYHSDYITCEDPSTENVGHKWTLSALLRHLRREGRDTGALMTAIEDVVVKSILSCAQSIVSSSRMFVPHFNNCFELYGFDILIDETLKPWLLEINLSPSLGCDSPLDARLKSSLLADTLTLVGIPAIDPVTRANYSQSSLQQPNRSVNLKMRIGACRRVHSAENMNSSSKKGFGSTTNTVASGAPTLTSEEARIVKFAKAQYQRRGGFVRIFPSQDSWQKYGQYLDPVSGVPVCSVSNRNSLAGQPLVPHNYNLLIHSHVLPNFDQTVMTNYTISDPPQRLQRYERVLPVCMRVSLDSGTPGTSRNNSASKGPPPDSKTAKLRVKQQLQQGMSLTLGESRRAFGMFLNCVLKRISNSTSEQSVHHAELVMRFLKKTSHSLKMPYNLKSPSQKMSDKDKAAVIAKQLNDFLYIYHRETDLYTSLVDEKNCITNIHFAKFLYGASEADLEDILLMVLKKEGNVATFIGDKLSPLCVDLPPAPRLSSPAQASPPRHHQLLRFLSYVTPVHSRRYRPPTPESTTLPSLSDGNVSQN